VINRLLVANRAEIASRVFRTCRALGIETVAIHSDADAALPYVREADVAVHLPGTAPSETYLRGDLVIDAARRTGADAIHPGYGFLSENADFARAVIDAGLVWVGPAPDSIEKMGSKVEAKKLMEAAGVPVLGNLSADSATEADLPLLVKASAGGGGRGMRIVRSLAELPAEVEKASAEAESAFGDGTVFVEPYVENGRHVEVQVVGHAGGVLVLGERDCSIQRRHQKVVEESPAPRLPDAVRAALHEAAHAAAAAIDYRGAGTVEFLYDAETERFFFLEMNTRLQVEHPVTELVHGVDLVDLQLRVAEGPTPVELVETGPTGHAIEVRLYAEDPAADWQPQSGLLTRFEFPAGDGIRVDSGFETGTEVSTHYDAMLAKVITWAPTREQAARRLADALVKARIHGVVTNRDLLVGILRDEAFLAGDVSTAFLEGLEVSTGSTGEGDRGAAVAAAIALAERAGAARTVQRGIPVGWRNVVSQPHRTEFDGDVTVEWLRTRDGYLVDGVTVLAASPTAVTLEADGVRTTYDVVVTGDAVDVDSAHGHVRLDRVPRFTDPADAVASGSLLAPMPGTVVSVAVEVGAEVAPGQPVLVLEAMKMQHTVSAPHAGVVAEIDVEPGAQVAAGEVLAVVEEA
jgi:propionyl-CoA carboxylase alpha chain